MRMAILYHAGGGGGSARPTAFIVSVPIAAQSVVLLAARLHR